MKRTILFIIAGVLAYGSAHAGVRCSGQGTFKNDDAQTDVTVVVIPEAHEYRISLTTEKGTRTWAIPATQPHVQPYRWGTQYQYPGDFVLKVRSDMNAEFQAFYPEDGNELNANDLVCAEVER